MRLLLMALDGDSDDGGDYPDDEGTGDDNPNDAPSAATGGDT